MTYSAPRNADGHSDRAAALALCCLAAKSDTNWTFDPVVVVPDSGTSAAIGTYDNFTTRKLD